MQASEHGHVSSPPVIVTRPPREHPHPGPLEYVRVAVALAIVTALEVGLFYMDLPDGLLAGLLLFLSGIKFSLVVLWFMHLKFDSRLFSWFFSAGLAIAIIVYLVVLATLRL